MNERIDRHAAQSGQVEYSNPIELHNTERLRIEFVPFFIPRTEANELACKIIRTDKARGWEQTGISLQESAIRRLYDALGSHLQVAKEDAGGYVVLKKDGTIADDSSLSDLQVTNLLREIFRVESLVEHLQSVDIGEELTNALKTSLRLRELRGAVAELDNHLREGTPSESIFQEWCERHSWSFGNAYVVNDQLRAISSSDKIDLLLPRNLGGFRDLIELKGPDKSVILWDSSHKSWHWSADVSKAIGQCHRYLDVLHSEVGLSGLRDQPEVIAYHPRATIVIGRSVDWEDEQHRALHGLNRRLSSVSIISYDHLLAQARRTLELVEAPEAETEVIVPTSNDWDFEDDPW